MFSMGQGMATTGYFLYMSQSTWWDTRESPGFLKYRKYNHVGSTRRQAARAEVSLISDVLMLLKLFL